MRMRCSVFFYPISWYFSIRSTRVSIVETHILHTAVVYLDRCPTFFPSINHTLYLVQSATPAKAGRTAVQQHHTTILLLVQRKELVNQPGTPLLLTVSYINRFVARYTAVAVS